MTTDLVAPYAIYTVTGVGPYAVPWPYRSGTCLLYTSPSPRD